jgi:NADH:ubiquinone oxidoreductase subunit 3 (subunit A)
MSLNPWIFIGLFFAVGWILPFTPVALGWLLSPKRPNSVKQEPYECGVEMVGSPWAQFRGIGVCRAAVGCAVVRGAQRRAGMVVG